MLMAPVYVTEQDRHRLQDLIEVVPKRFASHLGLASYLDALELGISRSRGLGRKFVNGDLWVRLRRTQWRPTLDKRVQK
jgi:hypothetical protein